MALLAVLSLLEELMLMMVEWGMHLPLRTVVVGVDGIDSATKLLVMTKQIYAINVPFQGYFYGR